MARPVDLIIGNIKLIENDRLSGWEAFFKKDKECESLRKELELIKRKLKKRVSS